MQFAIFVWMVLNCIFVVVLIYTSILWSLYWRKLGSAKSRTHDSFQYHDEGFRLDGLRKLQIPHVRGSSYSSSNTTWDERSIRAHKLRILARLRQIELGSPLHKHDNRYHVRYLASRHFSDANLSRQQLLCRLWRHLSSFSDQEWTISGGDEFITRQGLNRLLPDTPLLLPPGHYNTCAVVSSSGALKGSRLGHFIDSHDAVLRFNDAPAAGHEDDVGARTSVRVLNSRVATSDGQFDFFNGAMFRNVSLLAWDPGQYGHSMQQWYDNPDFPIFRTYFERRLMLPDENFHLLSSRLVWHLWDFLQMHTHVHIPPHPPSSGLLGTVLMMRQCSHVHVIEYMPSVHMSPQCHYYSPAVNQYCSVGAWHPLATEKRLVYHMNDADDVTVFGRGVMSLAGFSQLTCDPQ